MPAWRRFAAQFGDVLVLLLLAATAVSGALWAWEGAHGLPYEALAIVAVVLVDATIGFVQEHRADTAVAALRSMTSAEACVVRDGSRRRVPAALVVPGDVVVVEEGATVPADARVLASTALHVSEASLTGESVPVTKETAPSPRDAVLGDRRSMLFAGTTATYGRARAVVTATGMRTELGRIAGLLAKAPPETTPLQAELARTGRRLAWTVLAIAAVMAATLVLVQETAGTRGVVDALLLAVALAVAAVPEGLPAVVTAVLAVGVQRMARRRAIVRRMAAVETLGCATVIASDKTGTLTRNEMTVRVVATASGRATFEGSGYDPRGAVRDAEGREVRGGLRAELELALTVAERANNAALAERGGRWLVEGDPTEGALLVAARKAGLDPAALDRAFPRVGEVPFSSERKRMSTLHEDAARDGCVVMTKGAPDVVLARCAREVVGETERALTDARRAEILRTSDALASQALRTLGVALRRVEGTGVAAGEDAERDLAFAGLVGMIDPPRAEAREAVERAVAAGIRPILVTGDHPGTASVIAQEIGIARDERVVTGRELATMPDDALRRAVREVSVYARVDPAHKLRLVEALRAEGHVVAMTGDGVNDAPALEAADVGVAMGVTGTDVAKGAADVVLADDDFATIVAAVEEGRAIHANIRKFLLFLLSSNAGEVATMFLGVVLAGVLGLAAEGPGIVAPLLATQLLWVNLVTDGLPALALGLEPADPGRMRRPPRARDERVVTARMARTAVLVGAITAAGTLLALDASLPRGLVEGDRGLVHGRTMAFTTLVLFQMVNVFNARSETRSAFSRLFTNARLFGAVGLSIALQAAVVHAPGLQRAFGTTALGVRDWLVCAAIASAVLAAMEAVKSRRRANEARAAPHAPPTLRNAARLW